VKDRAGEALRRSWITARLQTADPHQFARVIRRFWFDGHLAAESTHMSRRHVKSKR
jgi:hypothetical protein